MNGWTQALRAAISPHSGAAVAPLARASVLIAVVFVFGIVGYRLFGGPEYSLLDAVYMTAITLTTVGYTETIDMSDNVPARVFTVVLLVVGVGSFLYFFTTLTSFIVEGSLDRIFVKHRMRRHIERLSDHFIVCGAGHTGQHVVDELVATRRPLVLVERSPDVAHTVYDTHGGKVPVVVGDAAEDETLHNAGVERATGLVTCFSSDKDNLIVAFSARALNPNIRIVCRSVDDRVSGKMKLAGADAVVSPNTIGGLRMVSELIRPKAVSFLDLMLREHPDQFRVEDLTVQSGSRIAGLTLKDLRTENLADVLIVAVHRADDQWIYNPDGAVRLDPGTSVVFIADPGLRARFEKLAHAP